MNWPGGTWRPAWNANVYLDTDVILALLKVEDWLKSAVDLDAIDAPVTSTATAIEVQYVMQNVWSRERLASAHAAIVEEGVDLVPLTAEDVGKGGELRKKYIQVGVFDSIHLGTAWTRDEAIVSTDTLFPSIEEVDSVDPRTL